MAKEGTIIIACDSFLSLRNIHYGELTKYFKKVHIFVDPNQISGSQGIVSNAEINSLIKFDADYETELWSLMYRADMARKVYNDGITTIGKIIGGGYRYHEKHDFRRLVYFLSNTIKFLSSFLDGLLKKHINLRSKIVDLINSTHISNQYHDTINQLKPDAVIGFSPEGYNEIPLLVKARIMGIPTAIMIRSRDNITSKIRFLPDAEQYYVWSNSIKNRMLKLYPEIKESKIHITGSPQFDHHLNLAKRLNRSEFFNKIELDENRPLIVYTMATPEIIPNEIEIAQYLADAANKGLFIDNAQLLVRGHPRMFGSDVKLLKNTHPEAKVYPKPTNVKYKSVDHEASLVKNIIDDEIFHLSLLEYQDVQVNICGTMTIDSAVFDKPIVNVFYDQLGNDQIVRNLYKRTDVKEMMAYKASKIATSPEQCIELINNYLNEPKLDSIGRKKASEEDCGFLDGQSGLRIAENIKSLFNNNRVSD